jgi:4-amino-4-deoxy-L-arabinose transferase-like glycosyltransferase
MRDCFWWIRQMLCGKWVADPWTPGEFLSDSSSASAQLAQDGESEAETNKKIGAQGDLRDRVPRPWIIALAIMLFVYLSTCGIPRLFDQIDGQYAGAAREMMERGDWLIPTQNEVPRLQKPPLVYWFECASMSVLGVNEFAARLPVALATIGWFLATGLLASRVIGTWSAGFAAALTLAMFTGTFFFTHLVMPEPFLCGFLALSFWSFLKARQMNSGPEGGGEAGRWLLAAWAFIALSALAKGIHGLLIPVVATSVAAWLRPSLRPTWRKFILRPHGWILFLAVLTPWYMATEWRYRGFLTDHFFNEQIGSALSRRVPPDSDRVPLQIFWLEQLVLLFPISLLFPAAIRAALKGRKNLRSRLNEEGTLLLAWFLVVALGITLANVQDYYLMIVWAPIAVGMAWAITKNTISFKWPGVIVGSLGTCGIVTALLLGASQGNGSTNSAGAEPLVGDTILNVFQVLPPTVWKEIIPLLCLASILALAAGIMIFTFNRRGRADLCLAGFALLMAAIFAIASNAMLLVEDEFSSAKVATLIDSRGRPESTVIAEGNPNEKTTLFFYLHRPVFWVGGRPEIEFATRTLGIGLDHYLTREQVAKRWGETKQVFLVIEKGALADWENYLALNAERSKPIGTCGSRMILVND